MERMQKYTLTSGRQGNEPVDWLIEKKSMSRYNGKVYSKKYTLFILQRRRKNLLFPHLGATIVKFHHQKRTMYT